MTAPALLVPCYNAARYLPRLAGSVRDQTVPFSEILCYDDGSTDDTVRIARELGFRILSPNTNAGPAAARNRLLAATSAEWVHFHDADDLLDPRFVERMSAAIGGEGAPDVAVCHMDWLTESTRTLEYAWRYDGAALAADALSATISNPIGVIACVYRRDLLRRVGGFDERFRTWEDGDLHVRLAAAGARFLVVPEVLSIGLRHASGASAEGEKVIQDRMRLLERYAEDYPSCRAVFTQAEQLAIWQVENNRPGAERMLALCRRSGHPVPTTRHPLWRVARAVLPAPLIIRLRARLRRLQSR